MYCRNCGARMEAEARYCSMCGYDHGGPDYTGPQQWGGPSNHDAGRDQRLSPDTRRGVMNLSILVTFLFTIIGGITFGVIAIVLLGIYFLIIRKSDTQVLMGVVYGGIIGIVIGYALNVIIFATLAWSLF